MLLSLKNITIPLKKMIQRPPFPRYYLDMTSEGWDMFGGDFADMCAEVSFPQHVQIYKVFVLLHWTPLDGSWQIMVCDISTPFLLKQSFLFFLEQTNSNNIKYLLGLGFTS